MLFSEAWDSDLDTVIYFLIILMSEKQIILQEEVEKRPSAKDLFY